MYEIVVICAGFSIMMIVIAASNIINMKHSQQVMIEKAKVDREFEETKAYRESWEHRLDDLRKAGREHDKLCKKLNKKQLAEIQKSQPILFCDQEEYYIWRIKKIKELLKRKVASKI